MGARIREGEIMVAIFDGDPGLHEQAEQERIKHRHARLDSDWEQPAPDAPWPVLDHAALHGLAGDVVTAIAPHSESDPVAILVQFLAMVGNAIGRGPYCRVEGDRHHLNLFALLVGETAKARKGTSLGRVRQIMQPADSDWEQNRIESGLSTGEGVIRAVRDPVTKQVKNDDSGMLEEKTVDAGVVDKRLLVVEAEFARVLAVLRRDGNTLSAILRDAWDRGRLGLMTKTNAARATGAHLSVIAHITTDELRRELDSTALVNGFANRFLMVCVRRARQLPFGGSLEADVALALADRTHFAIEAARQLERIVFSQPAAQLWETHYGDLSDGRPGLFGAVTARAEAQTVRLATLFAVLDRSSAIELVHLEAALALWRYCTGSARYIFGDATGDPDADEILRILRQRRPEGLSRTEISEVFTRNRSTHRIELSLGLLLRHRLARWATRGGNGAGRPAIIWFAV
jgi:hypothetical protein